MKLIESETYVNLARAYAGECQARTRYEFIEYGARKEGFEQLAEIIDTVVYNEFNHARILYTKLQDANNDNIENIEICAGYPFKEKWNLEENLMLASEDEKAEVKIYNDFAKTAEKEGFKELSTLFTHLAEIENCHAMLFKDLHKQLSSGSLYKKKKAVKWKCAGCGHEETSTEAWKTCPVCQAKQGFVMIKLSDGE